MKSKRGLSTIVATVLLILLTLVLAFSIAELVIPFVKKNLDRSTECINYGEYFDFDDSLAKSNCYDKSKGKTFFSVRAKNDEFLSGNVQGFKVVFLKEGSTNVIDLREGDDLSEVKMMDSAKNKIFIPHAGDTYTYVFDSADVYESLEVYPMLKNSRVCEKYSGRIKLVNCATR